MGETCDCNFDSLPALLFISHMVLPLLTIPLTWVFIPDVKMTESIDCGDEYYELISDEKKNELSIELKSHDGL